MASKTFIYKLGSGNFAQLELHCTSTSNVANNTSTITAILYGRTLISGSIDIESRPNTAVTVDAGNSKSFTAGAFSRSTAGLTKLGETTHTVMHDSDGTKKVTMNCRYPAEATVQGVYHGTVNVGGSFSLDTILRGRVTVGNASRVPIKGQVYVGDANKVPRKAKAAWIGDANKVPRRSK